ncbi:MAG: hypothetical protein LBV69_05980 [Bacteroidales bacterium]|jgi:hypothetical protein|nr:hypothetical protein [Bacteroidales bacterium]
MNSKVQNLVKKHLFLLVIIISDFALYSQDLIVTTKNDSINCNILRVTNKNYYYTILKDTTNYKISISDVKSYKYSYYKRKEIKEDAGISIKKITAIEENYNYYFLSIGLFVGRKNLLKGVDKIIPHYVNAAYSKKLSSGYYFGGDLTYYANKYVGLGLRFDYFSSYNRQDSLEYIASVRTGSVFKEERRIGYISNRISLINAEFYVSGKYNFKKSYVYGNLGFSMLRLTDQNFDYYLDNVIKGQTFGLSIDLGYDWKIIPQLALGLKFSYIAGKLRTINFNENLRELNKNSYIGLGEISVGVSLKFWIGKK